MIKLNATRPLFGSLQDLTSPYAQSFSGELSAEDFKRVELLPGSRVEWTLDVRVKKAYQAGPNLSLTLWARATLLVQCQRCMKPMEQAIAAERSYWFASSLAELERWEKELDWDADIDVIQLDAPENEGASVLSLIEDEFILTQPFAPKHSACPDLPQALSRVLLQEEEGEEGLQGAQEEQAANGTQKNHPFAVLAQLRRGK